MNNARYVAVLALQKCENGGYANLVLNGILKKTPLSEKDKGFVSVLVYGTLEKIYTLDYILQSYITKPIARLDAPIRAILRMGLYQCMYLDSVPTSAAINEAVKLTRLCKKSSASGMVNAVLRKAGQTDTESLVFNDEITKLSVIYSVSPDIARLLKNEYPEKYKNILESFSIKPKVTIRVNALKTNEKALQNELIALGVKTENTELENCLAVTDCKGDITALKQFESGFFYIQGMPSQLAVEALGAAPGEKIIDLCAAPGGKSAGIAQKMNNTGVLYSCDIQKSRLPLIEKQFSRLGIKNAKVLYNDAAVYNSEFENSDAVLCDVPCSGLGIAAKKPDIRQKGLDGIESLIKTQKAILNTAAKYVKKGGRLVYSTCTINPDENEKVIIGFLENNKDFVLKKSPFIPSKYYDNKDWLLFLPNKSQPDGFFVAYLERL